MLVVRSQMLVVRSQSRWSLMVDDVVYSISHYKSEGIYDIEADYTKNGEVVLATYSTKQKALKVLDMLEAFANNDKELLHNLGYKGCILIAQHYGYGSIEYKLKSLSFQFPQDDEVE